MGLGLDLVRIAPSVAVGGYLLATALLLHREAPRSPAMIALGALLALRGTLNVVAPLWFVPEANELARRLWPTLDVLVAGAAFVWYASLPHRVGRFASGARWRLFAMVAAGSTAVWVAVFPDTFWGTGTRDGALQWLNGVKFLVYAALAVSLFRAYRDRWGMEWRRSGLWLSAAFALNVMHWVATDLIWVTIVGAQLADVRTSPDHYMRLLALLPMLWLLWLAFHTSRTHERRGIRRGSGVLLAALLLPVMLSVLVLDLFVFDALSAAAANDWLVLWLDALWTLPVPFVVWMIFRHVPDGVEWWLASDP